MGIERNRDLPFQWKGANAGGRGKLLAQFGLLSVSWSALLGVAPAIANASSLSHQPQSQPQITADDVALTCGTFPVDAYVNHDSATLRHAFCELLAFSPLTFSTIDSFVRSIVPETLASNVYASAEEMTRPSFWWSRNSIPRRFGSYRLVDSWTAYEIRGSAIRVIDVRVNSQIWSILRYSERYGALNHLAEEAKAYQYNLRLFNSNQRDPSLIGLYVCDFLAPSATSSNTQALDTGSGCVAMVDEDSISRMQAKLETPDEVAQPAQDSQPTTNSVVGANLQENASQAPSAEENSPDPED